jgi:hypothetical protein
MATFASDWAKKEAKASSSCYLPEEFKETVHEILM